MTVSSAQSSEEMLALSANPRGHECGRFMYLVRASEEVQQASMKVL